jgi:hypothetical protein
MTTAAVETIYRKINALKPKDRLALERKLARRLELEWQEQIVPIRQEARRRKIDQTTIDKAIFQHRYGK